MKLFSVFLSLLCTSIAVTATNAQVAVFRQLQLPSAILHETRTVNICLPQSYREGDTTHYTVVYLPDGGLSEDFLHVAGLIRFSAQSWVNRFPEAILVGIENTSRQRDFTFPVHDLDFLQLVGFSKERIREYGGSAMYIRFLEQELMPLIAQKFRGGKERCYAGESFAGLLGTEILLHHRHLFDTYFIISPSLWWGREKLLDEAPSLLRIKGKKPVRVCIAAPAAAELPLMYREARSLYAMLKEDADARVYFEYLPEETHATVMHEALYRAFRRLSEDSTSR